MSQLMSSFLSKVCNVWCHLFSLPSFIFYLISSFLSYTQACRAQSLNFPTNNSFSYFHSIEMPPKERAGRTERNSSLLNPLMGHSSRVESVPLQTSQLYGSEELSQICSWNSRALELLSNCMLSYMKNKTKTHCCIKTPNILIREKSMCAVPSVHSRPFFSFIGMEFHWYHSILVCHIPGCMKFSESAALRPQERALNDTHTKEQSVWMWQSC